MRVSLAATKGLVARARLVSSLRLAVYASLMVLAVLVACSQDPDASSKNVPSTLTTAPAGLAIPTRASATQTTAPTTTVSTTSTAKRTPADPVTPTTAPTLVPTEAPTPVVPDTPTSELTPRVEQRNPDAALITTLSRYDAEGFLAGISDNDRQCLLSRFDLWRFIVMTSEDEYGSAEETADFVQCLGDESVLSLYVAELVGHIGQLSEQTSSCIFAGLAGTEIRRSLPGILVSPQEWRNHEAVLASVGAYYLSNSCLNDEEFKKAELVYGMMPEDRAAMQCVVDKVGGPEGMARLEWWDGDLAPAFVNAKQQCAFLVTQADASPRGPLQPPGAGLLIPIDLSDPASMAAGLSADEFKCVRELAGDDDPTGFLASHVTDFYLQDLGKQLYGCMNNETLLSMLLGGTLGPATQISRETSTCIRAATAGLDMRRLYLREYEIPEAQMVAFISVPMTIISCPDESDLQSLASALDTDPGERDSLLCLTDALGGPEGTVASLTTGDEIAVLRYNLASLSCDLPTVFMDWPS